MDSRGYEILSAEEVEELKKVSPLCLISNSVAVPLESGASHASMVTIDIAMDGPPLFPLRDAKVDNGPLP